MRIPIDVAWLAAGAIAVNAIHARAAAAQQTTLAAAPLVPTGGVATVITFNMQINLTNLSTDLERVRLACMIQSAANSWPMPSLSNASALAAQLTGADSYVAQGKAVGTLTLQVPIATAYLAPDAVGKQASYMRFLFGYTTSLQRWDVLHDQQPNATFRVSQAPPQLTGSFVW